MTDETRAFRTRLEDLTHEAKENGNRISVQQVREKLKDTGLDETKLQMVCSYPAPAMSMSGVWSTIWMSWRLCPRWTKWRS